MTYLILIRMYLSGTRPSRPSTQPRHQSLLAWQYSRIVAPFVKLTSRELRAVKSYWATASSISDSAQKLISAIQCQTKLTYSTKKRHRDLLPKQSIDISLMPSVPSSLKTESNKKNQNKETKSYWSAKYYCRNLPSSVTSCSSSSSCTSTESSLSYSLKKGEIN